MEGEVSYQVTKGKPFIVNTKNGTVEVLGTAFRVIHTDGYFEVLCAEGKVKVTHQEETYFLTKGLSFNTIDQQINEFEPTQFGNTSSVYYSKVPLNHVIHLIENLYNLNIELQSNKSFYFTGVVPLNNKEKAIKSISLPFSFGIKEGDNGNLILIEE
jgi:ferric-dicitrate binding protein FerR (iron transport regulator)